MSVMSRSQPVIADNYLQSGGAVVMGFEGKVAFLNETSFDFGVLLFVTPILVSNVM